MTETSECPHEFDGEDACRKCFKSWALVREEEQDQIIAELSVVLIRVTRERDEARSCEEGQRHAVGVYMKAAERVVKERDKAEAELAAAKRELSRVENGWLPFSLRVGVERQDGETIQRWYARTTAFHKYLQDTLIAANERAERAEKALRLACEQMHDDYEIGDDADDVMRSFITMAALDKGGE